MKFPLNFNNPFKKENLTEGLQNFREERENRKTVKRNFKENIPLNFRERSNARASLLASVIVLAVLVILFNQLDYRMIRKPAIDAQKKAAAAKEKPETTATTNNVTTASVIAVGDNLYHQSLIDAGASEDGNWNYDKIYTHITDAIKDADIRMIDQETVFTTDHDSVSSYPSFATPTEVGDAIVKAGFNVVESANNHIDDFGEGFLTDTLNFWKTKYPDVTLLGIHDSQEDADTVKIREVNGIKIAFLDYTYGTNVGGIEGKDYMIDMIRKEKITTMIQKAKQQADCIIFVAHWGTEDETMPNEYEKQWAAYLMEQGVNVIIGEHPHVLQPYGRISDGKGNETVVFYSLGNFVSTQQKLEELLGGMAKFTIQKTVENGKTSIQILTPTVEPLVMHYNSDAGEFGPYMLSDYTEELASQNGVQKYIGDGVFTLDNLKKKFNEIMSMNVTPSTGTNLLDVTIDTDLNMVDSSGNIVEDTDSITAEQYYADKGIDVNSEDFNSADSNSGNTDDSSDDSSDDGSDDGSYDDSSYDDSSYDDGSYDDGSYDDSNYDDTGDYDSEE
ncbi:MAG: CapA family protein [Clostridia bacterium]